MLLIPSLLKLISFPEIGASIIKRDPVDMIDLFIAIHEHCMKVAIFVVLALSRLSGGIESTRSFIPSCVPSVDRSSRVIFCPNNSDLSLSKWNEAAVNAVDLEWHRIRIGFSRLWSVMMIQKLVALALDNAALWIIDLCKSGLISTSAVAEPVRNFHDPLPVGRRRKLGGVRRLTLSSKPSALCCLSSNERIA